MGSWVSKWESTALCLEALYVWKAVENRKTEIERVIKYICSDENKEEWLCSDKNFSSEESANDVLASIILASVLFRVSRSYFPTIFEQVRDDILMFF